MKAALFLSNTALFFGVSHGLTMTTEVSSFPKKLTAMGPYSPSLPKSKSVPFLPRPPSLEGYAGNKEFDPLFLSETAPMDWMREAELKVC